MFFQRKNSKKVKDPEGSQKKGKDGRGKNDRLFGRAKGGLDGLAGSSAKNDAGTANLQGDVKSGSGIELGSHSDASSSKGLDPGNKDMDAFSAVMDKVKGHPEVMEKVSAVMDQVKNHPEVVEKVKDEMKSLADALHLRRHGSNDKEPESEEKAKEGEAEGSSADKTEEPNVLEQAVEEIQAVAAALQQTAPAAETETETPVETAAAAEGDKPEEGNREVEKDDPNKRLDFAGFFAMLFERFCSPGNKKKD